MRRYSGIEPLEARIAPAFASVVNLDHVAGIILSNVGRNEDAGSSVSDAGDVNGDGVDDIIFGVPNTAAPTSAGRSYVMFGSVGAPPRTTLGLGWLSGSAGFAISTDAIFDRIGTSVSAAGDMNGDGFDDLIVGSTGGAASVVFGKATFGSGISIAALDGSNGFKISFGESASVSAAGDVNGDHFDDVIVSVSDLPGVGTYVVFGKENGFAAELNVGNLNGTNGVKLGDVATTSLSAGDINGDGLSDVMIGSSSSSPTGAASGMTYVVYGKKNGFGANLNLSALDGNNGFTISGVAANDTAGRSVSGTGDVNGDGFEDLIIGAPGADAGAANSGAAYVVFGKQTGFGANLNLSALDGSNGFKLSGVAADDLTGESVSGAGDVNGDGFADVIIGANRVGNGLGYVIFGKANFTADLSLSDLDGKNGFQLFQVNFDPRFRAPLAVSGAGDVNHDGFDDLVIGSRESAPPGGAPSSGITYVVFGKGPKLNISEATVNERDDGTTGLQFTVTLSQASTMPVTVKLSTIDGTATAGTDYTATSPATLTFAPGELTKTFTVNALGDTAIEIDETFSVILSDATGAVIGDGSGLGTLQNDDGPFLRIAGGAVLEGDSGTRSIEFTVSLSPASPLPATVNYNSFSGTALAGSDFTASPAGAQLTFAPGETTKTIIVDVFGDTSLELSETFTVSLFGAVNAVIAGDSAVATILDDDTDVKLTGKRTATYIDPDGDLVTIAVSKGVLKVEDFTLFSSGVGAQLALVDFSGEAEFAGANLTITANRAPGTPAGIRTVDVGSIDARGIDLGKVIVQGDLGQIDAGNDDNPRPGVLSLSVNSLGLRGLATQLPGGSLQSEITGALKSLKLAGHMQDAELAVSGDIGGMTITGSVRSGVIHSDGKIGALTIHGNLEASVHAAAVIDAQGDLAAITIKGNVIGSVIRTDGKIGPVKIAGDLAGRELADATITARGNLLPTTNSAALAIASLTIGGSVSQTQILAGYDRTGLVTNSDVRIGAVTVGGDWIASDLAAGVSAGADGMFGTADDAAISRTTPLVSKIASILIKRTATGTTGGSDGFGFVAEEIGAFKAGTVKLTFTPGASNDLSGAFVGTSGNLLVHEVA